MNLFCKRTLILLPTIGSMDRSVDIAAVEHVAVEIEEVTPREAGKLETEAKCNDNNGTIVTESEGTILH